jgi:hypothetical protein
MFIAVNSISPKGVNTFFGFITNWQCGKQPRENRRRGGPQSAKQDLRYGRDEHQDDQSFNKIQIRRGYSGRRHNDLMAASYPTRAGFLLRQGYGATSECPVIASFAKLQRARGEKRLHRRRDDKPPVNR